MTAIIDQQWQDAFATFDMPFDGYAHFDDALGYGVHGPRLMRKMLSKLGYGQGDDAVDRRRGRE